MTARVIDALRLLQDALDDEQIGACDRSWVEGRAGALARLGRGGPLLPPELCAEVAVALRLAGWQDERLIRGLQERGASAPPRYAEAIALAVDLEGAGYVLRLSVRLFPGAPGVSGRGRWPTEVMEAVEQAVVAALEGAAGRLHARWSLALDGDVTRTLEVEGPSLGLAAAVATRAALERRVAPAWGLTGAVGLDGRLSAVGALPLKLRLAAERRLEGVIFPAANLPLSEDVARVAEVASLGLTPALDLRHAWRALGWAERPATASRRGWAVAACVVALSLAVSGTLLRRSEELELCLDPAVGVDAALVVTALADRPGSARAYLLDRAGGVTQVAIGAQATVLNRERRALVPAVGASGERVVLDGSDEALLVLWSEAPLPSPGDALRAIRDPTSAELTVRPLSWEAEGGSRCARTALVPSGELALYRAPLPVPQ